MSKEMNHGVRILIDRMQTNPEDFERGGRFWSYTEALTDMAQNPDERDHLFQLADEDRAALIAAWKQHLCDIFSTQVMKRLTEESGAEEKLAVGKSVKAKMPKVLPNMPADQQLMIAQMQMEQERIRMQMQHEQQRQYYEQRLRNSASGLMSDINAATWNDIFK